jgi:hypothetical protein
VDMNTLFASINGTTLIHELLFLLFAGIVLGIIWVLIQKAPFLNDLFKQILGYVVYLIGALILINFLLGLAGHPIIDW